MPAFLSQFAYEQWESGYFIRVRLADTQLPPDNYATPGSSIMRTEAPLHLSFACSQASPLLLPKCLLNVATMLSAPSYYMTILEGGARLVVALSERVHVSRLVESKWPARLRGSPDLSSVAILPARWQYGKQNPYSLTIEDPKRATRSQKPPLEDRPH